MPCAFFKPAAWSAVATGSAKRTTVLPAAILAQVVQTAIVIRATHKLNGERVMATRATIVSTGETANIATRVRTATAACVPMVLLGQRLEDA